MAFWSNPSRRADEPKKSYRWLLYMGGIDPWIAKKVTKPGYAISKLTDKDIYGNLVFSPGILEWKDIKVTLVDPGSPDLTATLYKILKESGYKFPEADEPGSFEGVKLKAGLGRVKIQQIANPTKGVGRQRRASDVGPRPKIIEEWVLYNAWIQEANFGQLDYTSDDLVEIELTISYEYAKLNEDNKSSAVKKKRKTFDIKKENKS